MTTKKLITKGDKFTKLTAITEIEFDRWICVCDCGNQKIVGRKVLRKGDTKSCGCLHNENVSRKHGHSPKKGKSLTYKCWRSMMQRCYRVKEKAYMHYGGRGISVCDRWHDFVKFLADMGEVPAKLTLDRKDNNGNYEPTNCRWATRSQQLRNTRISQFVTHNGVTKSIWDWSEEIGIKGKTLKKRLSSGWDINTAMTTPTLSIKEVSALGISKRWIREP